MTKHGRFDNRELALQMPNKSRKGREVCIMRVPIVIRLSAVCVAVAALTASANASAHYYAILATPGIFNGDADHGDLISIKTNTLHNTCNPFTREFVTHEMWYLTDTSGNSWIEVGFLDGGINGSISCVTDADFWADKTPERGLNEHFPGNGWSFGTWYTAEIANVGSCKWGVWLGGVTLGTSASVCPGSGRALQAGIESTSQTSGSADGFLSGWWEQNGSGTWRQGWDGADGFANWPPSIKWADSSKTETEEWL